MENNTEKMITITKKKYEELLSASKFLDCLHGAGVDNWDGYLEAQEMMEEDK